MFKFQSFLTPAIAVACVASIACVACGASFTAQESGNGAFAGSGNAGEASGGLPSSAGSSSIGDAGEVEAGGTSSAGQGSTSGGTTSTGGTVTGSGGRNWGNGGRNWGNGGGSTGADCATLEQEYRAAVEKARACSKGSMDQCSSSSVAQAVGGCGCPVLINATSEAGAEAKQAYQAYQDAKCDYTGGPPCELNCPSAVTATCAPSGTAFVCTGVGIN